MRITKEITTNNKKNSSFLVSLIVLIFIALIGMFFGQTAFIDSNVVSNVKPLFNVNVEIPVPYKQTTNEVLATIKLLNSMILITK